jgi:hypothetical protein
MAGFGIAEASNPFPLSGKTNTFSSYIEREVDS